MEKEGSGTLGNLSNRKSEGHRRVQRINTIEESKKKFHHLSKFKDMLDSINDLQSAILE